VVHTLCLKVDQQYPGLQGVTPEPIAEVVQRLLAASGIAVTGGEGARDAELAISLRFEALSRTYTGDKVCYSGASAGGVLALTADERAALEIPVTFTRGAPFVIYGCAELASDAPFHLAWQRAVIGGLMVVWGQAVAANALQDEDHLIAGAAAQELGELGRDARESMPALIRALGDPNDYVRQEVAKALGQMGADAVPTLILALKDESAGVRQAAMEALGNIGPEAMEAVPEIIRVMEAMEYGRYFAAEPLKKITGQDFGEDVAAWRSWWESRS